jgi:hypothetical protein
MTPNTAGMEVVLRLAAKLAADPFCSRDDRIQKLAKGLETKSQHTTPKAVSAYLWHDNDTRNFKLGALDPKLQIPNTFTRRDVGKKDRVRVPTHLPAFPPHFETITTKFATKQSAI